MAGKVKPAFPFGVFLKELREKKGVTLKQVEEGTGMSNAYISQLETGSRRRLPTPDKLKALADYFNVSIEELLIKAGYTYSDEIKETLEQKIEKAFSHAISDPTFRTGQRIAPETVPLDVKRFVNELYEKNVKEHFEPKPYAWSFEEPYQKTLHWVISDIKRTLITDFKKLKQYIKYEVEVTCFEKEIIPPNKQKDRPDIKLNEIDPITHEVASDSANAKAEMIIPFRDYGHETVFMRETTNQALKKALKKLENTTIDWVSILFKGEEE